MDMYCRTGEGGGQGNGMADSGGRACLVVILEGVPILLAMALLDGSLDGIGRLFIMEECTEDDDDDDGDRG